MPCLQVIVPDLELDDLEMVDQVVVEMIRVNKTQNSEGEQNGDVEDGANISGKGEKVCAKRNVLDICEQKRDW